MSNKNNYNKKIRKNNKAQLKIQQMAFMLVAVFLFFSLVLLLFFRFSLNDVGKTARELEIQKAEAMVVKLASSPELIFENRPNSIDADKLMVLKSERKYKELWNVNGLIVRKIYPNTLKSEVECKSSNYPECNIIKVFTDKSIAPVKSYVALCRKQNNENGVYDKCELAVLMLDLKEKIGE
ncbi:hypothetical protein HYW74_00715 [Candidatus Pacearchaeota archaeon]|nr:hypothetical protein [Candidatus Pacearchaeota archaeon]